VVCTALSCLPLLHLGNSLLSLLDMHVMRCWQILGDYLLISVMIKTFIAAQAWHIPIMLRTQVYSLVMDRTLVDRELDTLR
jgi:hypothetical protein